MKAISLWQPWASAIALGLKSIETRGWATSYRGPLAIHAAKRWAGDQREFGRIEHTLGRLPARVPLGAIVAVCTLSDCLSTYDLRCEVGSIERIYGDYRDGRYGWVLTDIRPLPEPIPFKGAQGFFNVPDELLHAVLASREAA